eukprot:75543_1
MSSNSFSMDSESIDICDSNSGTFTMVILDFDDTLIPSRMYQLFANNFSIDIFQLFSMTKMRKLQNTIINALEQIRKQYENNGESIEFCIVSNAQKQWLDYMFNGSESHFVSSRIPIFKQYFEQHKIPIISAARETHKFLQKQFGDKASQLFAESKHDKWIWKYTTFSSVISSFQRETNKKCKQIISIGDGNHELTAAKQYCIRHKTAGINIKFHPGTTINQIIHQWTFIKNNLLKDISEKAFSALYVKRFYAYDLRKVAELKSDNNNAIIGNIHQLPAVQKYFQFWMDNLTVNTTTKKKCAAIKRVCSTVHKKMYSLDATSVESRNLKLILIKAICKNTEFNQMFNAYFLKMQRESKQMNENGKI